MDAIAGFERGGSEGGGAGLGAATAGEDCASFDAGLTAGLDLRASSAIRCFTSATERTTVGCAFGVLSGARPEPAAGAGGLGASGARGRSRRFDRGDHSGAGTFLQAHHPSVQLRECRQRPPEENFHRKIGRQLDARLLQLLFHVGGNDVVASKMHFRQGAEHRLRHWKIEIVVGEAIEDLVFELRARGIDGETKRLEDRGLERGICPDSRGNKNGVTSG